MKAHNLTVSVPSEKCDKNCQYCISNMTWRTVPDMVLVQRNMEKVKRTANQAGVTNVLITSKNEPFQNYDGLIWTCKRFTGYHLELQTNGIKFNRHAKSACRDLYKAGLNVMAFSIDKMATIEGYAKNFEIINDFKMITRVCINLTHMISKYFNFQEIMDILVSVGNIHQVLFRNITYPSGVDKENLAVKWIDKNVNAEHFVRLKTQMLSKKLRKIHVVPQTGITTYSYKGMSICFSDYCVQEHNQTDNIRSLIYQDNGHLYTNWNDPASIIF
jgi:organic radical activating enzyme